MLNKIYLYLREIKHQLLISAFGFSPTCHQYPSCSQYTVEKMQINGKIVGLAKGLWRILHCYHY